MVKITGEPSWFTVRLEASPIEASRFEDLIVGKKV